MVKVNKLLPKTARETYEVFLGLIEGFGSEEFHFLLFYGNPTENEISWCPDCRPAHADFVRFAQGYKGKARFHTVPVGFREEFNSENPFRESAPHLDGVPTLAVYKDGIMYLKLVDPTFEDLTYFVKRFMIE